MPIYKAPVNDTLFLLEDVLGYSKHADLPGFAEVPIDVAAAILEEAAKLAEETLQPLNMSGDRQGCARHPDGSVTTPAGFKEAMQAQAEGGWVGLTAPAQYGGQEAPFVIAAAIQEITCSANMAFAMYSGLTTGAIAALLQHGSDEIKQAYLPNMIAGRWLGTMNLTEPHCGTDLGLLKTKAVPNGDGSYAISGQKIFISAGEHDLSENIIHLVLARIEGAPQGVKGISLFVVPKFEIGPDGELGARNAVSCGSIEHKMGIHGNATCVMNFDGARGFLVGAENKGLAAMFVMMNEARLGVAIQGIAQSEVAYQNAAAYAKERLQGRALTGAKNPGQAADPIIVHPDVRRMLLEIRAFNEAARGLALWTALEADMLHRSPDAAARQAADDHLGLMTPVLKAFFTDVGFDNCVKGQQVFGGHGYVGDWGVEQFVRDARIAMIYEGANGIQALDLVGRKLSKDGGRAVLAFFKKVGDYAKEAAADEQFKGYAGELTKSLGHLQQATMWLSQRGMKNPDDAGAAASYYLRLFGLTAMGFMWLKILRAAQAQIQGEKAEMMQAKLITGAFFFERMSPETGLLLTRVTAGARAMMDMPAEMF